MMLETAERTLKYGTLDFTAGTAADAVKLLGCENARLVQVAHGHPFRWLEWLMVRASAAHHLPPICPSFRGRTVILITQQVAAMPGGSTSITPHDTRSIWRNGGLSA